MSLSYAPKVVTDGLVFYYDQANTKKSWLGAPTTNLHPIDGYISWPAQTIHFWNGNNWVVDSTYTHPVVDGPSGVYLGRVRKYTSGALSAVWSNTSHAYILKTAPMTAGQSYAMSAYTFLSGDCNIDGMNSSIEGASVSALAGGYVTGYDTSRKGTWQRQGLQGTGSGNVNFIVAYPYRGGVTDGSFTGFMLVGGAQVELGTFPTPYTDTTRSNTQAIIDLTGQNTITASSLTYASDGTFSFNGSSNYISWGSNSMSDFTSGVTLEVWVNMNASGTSWTRIFDFGAGQNIDNLLLCQYSSTTQLAFYIIVGSSQYSLLTDNTGITNNANTHFVATANGSNWYIYKNGIQIATQASAILPANVTRNSNYIGKSNWSDPYLNGKVYNAKIYNRALTAQQVQQNFAAQRGRYGI